MTYYQLIICISLLCSFLATKKTVSASLNIRTTTSIAQADCIIPYPDVHVSCNVIGEPNAINTTTVRCYKKNNSGDVYCMKCTERVPLDGNKPEGKKCSFVDRNDQPLLVK